MTNASLQQKADYADKFSRVLYFSLLVVITMWTFVIRPPEVDNLLIIWLVQTVPLLLFLPAVLGGAPRAHAWLCFVVLFYFTAGVLNAFADPSDLFGWLESTLSALLFCSSMMYVRWKFQLINQGL
ncbi:DUF2069 domain-containing protein [Aestuariirhabdus sp. Z084]|uniref:DUF2069 domain-containing protein n=1 Tax=Aestuariirhabdus haliotis TaxID=2918751 RepID=UPI00201B4128|nr:DUF2069 domain-containing protein [Aestuariirhabdus haliotis]MCL6416301.1 DUF2069 domain-containing protein [Aestuariirhabdus haliotis]MCL6420174.1 DUF2069 domain-containing protein [Aestuariirhabdus haliotis]